MTSRGKVVSFDRIKGYGFVAPEAGGEDVFIHVNDLYSEKSLLVPGCTVEFRLEEGDRGPKATGISVLPVASATASTAPAAAPVPVAAPAPAQPGITAAAESTAAAAQPTGEELCDVLTRGEFEHEITEALLRAEPQLSSWQILDIRNRLLHIAQGHGWSDR